MQILNEKRFKYNLGFYAANECSEFSLKAEMKTNI